MNEPMNKGLLYQIGFLPSNFTAKEAIVSFYVRTSVFTRKSWYTLGLLGLHLGTLYLGCSMKPKGVSNLKDGRGKRTT